MLPAPVTLGPILEFLRSLWALDHALTEASRGVRNRYGITATQQLVVRILGHNSGIAAGVVARVLHVHPSTLTPVLQQLVDRGLVRRAADPVDRRRAVLWLTARGERVDAASAADLDERVKRRLGKLAASEVFHARRVIAAIADALSHPEVEPAVSPRRRAVRAPRPRVTRLGAREGSAPRDVAPPVQADDAQRSSGK